MSEFFRCGDMVVMHSYRSWNSSSGSGGGAISDGGGMGEIPDAYPLNDLYPLMSVIADCSQSSGEPIAYIPYRVYAGDTVIMKQTDSGLALIPEDMCITPTFTTTGTASGVASATETAYFRGHYCPGPSCGAYGTYKKFTQLLCKPSGQTVDGFLTANCPNIVHLGNDVYGADSRGGGANRMEIVSPNAYEYVEFETNTPLAGADKVGFALDTSAPYPCKISHVSGNIYRVEAYPGYGGKFGLSKIEGGAGALFIFVSVGGGYGGYVLSGRSGAYRFVGGDVYSPQSRTVSITFKNTGRYGNYQ